MHLTHVLSIDFCMLLASSSCAILHMIKMTMHKNNANRFSKCEPRHKHINKSLKTLIGTNIFKSFIQCICASTNGFHDNSRDNYSMAMLSMEPRKWIIALHNNYSLTSYSISCRHITCHQKCCNCQQTKCYMCYHCPKIIETILSMCYLHTHH